VSAPGSHGGGRVASERRKEKKIKKTIKKKKYTTPTLLGVRSAAGCRRHQVGDAALRISVGPHEPWPSWVPAPRNNAWRSRRCVSPATVSRSGRPGRPAAARGDSNVKTKPAAGRRDAAVVAGVRRVREQGSLPRFVASRAARGSVDSAVAGAVVSHAGPRAVGTPSRATVPVPARRRPAHHSSARSSPPSTGSGSHPAAPARPESQHSTDMLSIRERPKPRPRRTARTGGGWRW